MAVKKYTKPVQESQVKNYPKTISGNFASNQQFLDTME